MDIRSFFKKKKEKKREEPPSEPPPSSSSSSAGAASSGGGNNGGKRRSVEGGNDGRAAKRSSPGRNGGRGGRENNRLDESSDDDEMKSNGTKEKEEKKEKNDDVGDTDDEDFEPAPPARKRKSPPHDAKTKTRDGSIERGDKGGGKVAPPPATPTSTQTRRRPPKYHPRSSKIVEHVPRELLEFADNPHPLPPSEGSENETNGGANFGIDDFAPRCLAGLTFVFSGILSTDVERTRRTSAAVSLSSPSRGSYYANRNVECSSTATPSSTNAKTVAACDDFEMSRESAVDVVKSLGGRVTNAVSGRTDYLVAGSVLEDGREVSEGSKYRKCVELWRGWRDGWDNGGEHRRDDDGDDGKGGKKKRRKSDGAKRAGDRYRDPNDLVEVVEGVREFRALVSFLSDWKLSTLTERERKEFEGGRRAAAKAKREEVGVQEGGEGGATTTTTITTATAASTAAAAVKEEGGSAAAAATADGAAGKPAAVVANPYAKKRPVANPYAKTSSSSAASNPYKKAGTTGGGAVSNPYAKSSSASVSNPYARSAAGGGGGDRRPTASAKSDEPGGAVAAAKVHQASGRELGANSLWADRYAPASSGEILGNSDSVGKLKRWLRTWEDTFGDPRRKVKGLTNPNGPWKAALLSGPPGIGKTTTATLVARESGRDVLELNASDARSKKTLSSALGDVTGSQVLSFDGAGSQSKKKRRCIIMDEVDGMGAGDRMGMSMLIEMIKKSKVPIICICNDRSSQKMKSLVQYCMDLRYRRPTKSVIARRAMEIGRLEGMDVADNAAEAMAESCGNDIRQVLNSLQMWSCKKKADGTGGGASVTYRDLKERQGAINKDEVLRVGMFDACKTIVEGGRNLAGADAKAATQSLLKRTDAYFVDYMLMGLMVHQNYLKVANGQFNGAKLSGDDDSEVQALNNMYEATNAMSEFGMCEENLRGGNQNWSLLPLCSILAVKVGHHAGGPTGGMLPGYPEFAGWLGKNSTRGKKVRLLQELSRHMNYKISADASELRMNYLPIMRQQFHQLLFNKDGAQVTEAIELMDEYGLDRDDIFENFDEFLFNAKELKVKKFGEMDGKAKAAFTRAYNAVAHKAQALVAEQGTEKAGRKKGGASGQEMGGAELDVVDDDAAAEESEEEEEEDLEALKSKFLKKGRKRSAGKGNAKAPSKKGKKKK